MIVYGVTIRAMIERRHIDQFCEFVEPGAAQDDHDPFLRECVFGNRCRQGDNRAGFIDNFWRGQVAREGVLVRVGKGVCSRAGPEDELRASLYSVYVSGWRLGEF